MKLFVSHSWMDKTTADRIAEDLENVAEVWLDVRRLKTGGMIQETIDEALASMDLVLLLWSAHAAASDGVGAELGTSLSLGKSVLPCRLDDAPLPEPLAGRLSVDFRNDYALGIARVNFVLFRSLAGEAGLDEGQVLASIKDAEGVLSYVNDYRNARGISGEDRGHWVNRILTSVNRATERGQELMKKLAGSADFVREVMKDLEAAGEDRHRVQEILNKVIRREHQDPETMGQVRILLERELQRLGAAAGASSEQAPVPAATPSAATPTPEPPAAPVTPDAREQIRSRLRGHVAEDRLEPVAALLHDYVGAAGGSLRAMGAVASQRGSAAGAQVVAALNQYLLDPNDLLPESSLGLWGYLDDAWLIHNTAYRLVEAGLVPAAAFPVDWQRIVSADGLVRQCLPPRVLATLESYLMQLLGMIAAEASAYSPAFSGGGGAYHPYMEGSSGGAFEDAVHDFNLFSLRHGGPTL